MRKKKEAGQMKTKEEGRRNNEYTLELPHLRSGGFIVTFGALVLLKATVDGRHCLLLATRHAAESPWGLHCENATGCVRGKCC